MTPDDTARLRELPCEHGVRWPHHCDDCLDRDIPPGKSLRDHPCYGISPIRPTEFAHRNSWPLSSKEHPYCSRCGTEIEGVNNKQKDGAPLCWEPRTVERQQPVDTQALLDRIEALEAGQESARAILSTAYHDAANAPKGIKIKVLSSGIVSAAAKLAGVEIGTSPALARLVVAARVVAYEDPGEDEMKELDRAVEAFASVVPWSGPPPARALVEGEKGNG